MILTNKFLDDMAADFCCCEENKMCSAHSFVEDCVKDQREDKELRALNSLILDALSNARDFLELRNKSCEDSEEIEENEEYIRKFQGLEKVISENL